MCVYMAVVATGRWDLHCSLIVNSKSITQNVKSGSTCVFLR